MFPSLDKLNVLVYGAGAREHAIADSIDKSPLLNKLYVAQTGLFNLGEVVEFSTYEDLAKKCVDLKIDMVVIGPEEPLCEGIVDVLKAHNVPCVGVNKEFAKLEGSKIFGKQFMQKHGIKTAKCKVVTDDITHKEIGELLPLSERGKFPYVAIKADGLCGGKGVVIANNKAFAEKTIEEFLAGKFGENSKKVLIEEFLQGEELTLMSFWDGKTLLHFLPCRDYKKLNKTLSAPNTGGMGAFCPVELTPFALKKLEDYKKQLETALKDEKADFVGFIYSGLIMAQERGSRGLWDWNVLEFNVRLGDPEAQAILGHLKTDFLSILKAGLEQKLDNVKIEYKQDITACLTLACEGYPKAPRDGKKITLPEETVENRYIKIYNAGVEEKNGELYSKGGRVLSLCTTSNDPFWELKNFAKEIEMENKYFRPDMEVR